MQKLNGNQPILFDHSNLESLINKQKKQLDRIVNIRSVKDINIYNNSFIVNQPAVSTTSQHQRTGNVVGSHSRPKPKISNIVSQNLQPSHASRQPQRTKSEIRNSDLISDRQRRSIQQDVYEKFVTQPAAQTLTKNASFSSLPGRTLVAGASH